MMIGQDTPADTPITSLLIYVVHTEDMRRQIFQGMTRSVIKPLRKISADIELIT